jgi:hypothetical protein
MLPPSSNTAVERPIELLHFEQLFEAFQHYSNLRLKQLTIYVAVNGGLLFAMFRQDAATAPVQVAALSALGVLAAFAFALLEVRTHRLQDHCRSLIKRYEGDFGLPHRFSDGVSQSWVVRGRLAVLSFIAGAAVLWIGLGALLLGYAYPQAAGAT